MYRVIKRNSFIFINSSLNDKMQRIVLCPRAWSRPTTSKTCLANGLHEFMLYDMSTRPEYEANIVAAEILLDNDELLDYIYTYNYSAEQIARAMGTDINLVLSPYRSHISILRSDTICVLIDHRSDFLKNN